MISSIMWLLLPWIVAVNLLMASIIFHEFGHWLYFRSLGKKVKIRFVHGRIRVGYPKDYTHLTRMEVGNVYLSGIFGGLIPIIFISAIFPIMICTIPFYLIGCKKDLINLWRVLHGA